jgi:hypothetical protein
MQAAWLFLLRYVAVRKKNMHFGKLDEGLRFLKWRQ